MTSTGSDHTTPEGIYDGAEYPSFDLVSIAAMTDDYWLEWWMNKGEGLRGRALAYAARLAHERRSQGQKTRKPKAVPT